MIPMNFNTEDPGILLDRVSYSVATLNGFKSIITNLDLSIYRGEWLAIVGTNGSGKSTLAKLITKLYSPASGQVIHQATVIPEKNGVNYPFIQMIFQNPETQMIGETVYEDVCFGLDNYGVHPSDQPGLAMEALEKVGLAAFKEYATLSLSGGQKQLLHVAGSLAVKPEVLVFDEATSMLDPLSRQQLLQTARKLHKEGTTILWVTQLLDELAECDRIIGLESGSIVFNGSKEKFFYGDKEELSSSCEQMGFPAPYIIQVSKELIHRGVQLNTLPFTAQQLGKAVSLCH
jgi:energy-coupling factor transport system ATP-binding protein